MSSFYNYFAQEEKEYLEMQMFTDDTFFIFPVMRADRNPDDGQIVCCRTDVFNGRLTQAVNYTQGKALELKNKENTIRTSGFIAALAVVVLVVITTGGEPSALTPFALLVGFISAFLVSWKTADIVSQKNKMQDSFRSLRAFDAKSDAYKIATVEEVNTFDYPEDVVHGIMKNAISYAKSSSSLQFSLFRDNYMQLVSPMTVFQLSACVALSSPKTHNEAVNCVEEMIYASHNEKKEIASRLFMLMCKAIDIVK